MSSWLLPKHDYWSTPFAESLLKELHLFSGATILDVASGHGIPAFYLAEQVGHTGQVMGIDLNANQVRSARMIQGEQLPWLRFECLDMRTLPSNLPSFDRITGNLSVMFFRPDRFATLQGLSAHLKPGGQIVLTFPSLGTFDSLWRRVDQEMAVRRLRKERRRFEAYVAERPSAEECRGWLHKLGFERIVVNEYPLEVAAGHGRDEKSDARHLETYLGLDIGGIGRQRTLRGIAHRQDLRVKRTAQSFGDRVEAQGRGLHRPGARSRERLRRVRPRVL